MKAYTDLEQSKRLAEILPPESADMRFCYSHTLDRRITGHYPMIGREPSMGTTPCWSLAALYSVLPTFTLDSSDDKYFRIYSCKKFSEWHNNPIDACVEIIIKLKDLNLL